MPAARSFRVAISIIVSLALSACGAVTGVKQTLVGSGPRLGKPIEDGDFTGGVAADEPRAAQIGKDILAKGGSAADAAAAIGFALSVTLPSRAGLGGGGACLVFAPSQKPVTAAPEAILFIPAAPASAGGDRPAAVPMLARGLFAIQSRHGVLPVEQVIAPAEQLASFGVPVSRAFADDLAVVGDALLTDRGAAQVFGPGGAVLGEGDMLRQPALGTSLARLRVHGVTDMYEGVLAQNLIAGMPEAGAAISAADLHAALPRLAVPLILQAGADKVAFLPPPADGGLAAAAAFQLLQGAPDDLKGAQQAALGAANQFRHVGAGRPDSTTTALPASTSFVTLDRTGGAVACAVSMGNLFGTGRLAPQTGILLAASPAAVPPPLLASAIAWSPKQNAFRAAIAGSGQADAPVGVADGVIRALAAKTAMPSIVPGHGRINAAACARYLPGDPDQCSWATDPRGAGLAAGDSGS